MYPSLNEMFWSKYDRVWMAFFFFGGGMGGTEGGCWWGLGFCFKVWGFLGEGRDIKCSVTKTTSLLVVLQSAPKECAVAERSGVVTRQLIDRAAASHSGRHRFLKIWSQTCLFSLVKNACSVSGTGNEFAYWPRDIRPESPVNVKRALGGASFLCGGTAHQGRVWRRIYRLLCSSVTYGFGLQLCLSGLLQEESVPWARQRGHSLFNQRRL